MLYVKNNMQYAVSFKVKKNGRDTKFEFDCLRIFRDTGNIATTGVTPIADEDFELLYAESKAFKDHVDKGFLSKTKESGATSTASKMNSLEKENEVLKKQLAEKTKEASNATTEELTEAKAENESLKAQLEALKKKSKKAKTEAQVDESEGF